MESQRLEISVGRLRLRSPLLTASGTSGSSGTEVDVLRGRQAIWDSLGAFVTKGVTLAPRRGNPEPRIIETRAGLLNSIGLQNKGSDRFLAEDLPKLSPHGLPVIVNISANSVDEYAALAAKLLENDDDQIAGLEINVSCPNLKEGGVSFGIDPRAVERIVSVVRQAVPRGRQVLIVTKLTPNITDITVPARAAIAGGTDALSLINTLRGVAIDVRAQQPWFQNVVAGLSGPAIKPIALCMVWDCYEQIPECRSGKVPILGIGGISTWEDVVEFLLAGATAVQVGTAWFVYPEVFRDLQKGLLKYIADKKTTVRDLIGKAHR
ncbi:dihydroorotate dehydrogenase [bacterium]|nr:dihydroorotate dehydrogenase [bacterium]